MRRPLGLALALALAGGPVGWSEEPDAIYVGAAACMDCHSVAARAWTVSKHARTWVVLATGRPEMIDPAAKGLVDEGHGGHIAAAAARLGSETDCHQCHTTAASVAPERRAPTFHLEDGVQCEACHGPGSVHVAAERGQVVADGPTIRQGTLQVCAGCHRTKPSHAILERSQGDVQKAWEEIAHHEGER